MYVASFIHSCGPLCATNKALLPNIPLLRWRGVWLKKMVLEMVQNGLSETSLLIGECIHQAGCSILPQRSVSRIRGNASKIGSNNWNGILKWPKCVRTHSYKNRVICAWIKKISKPVMSLRNINFLASMRKFRGFYAKLANQFNVDFMLNTCT